MLKSLISNVKLMGTVFSIISILGYSSHKLNEFDYNTVLLDVHASNDLQFTSTCTYTSTL